MQSALSSSDPETTQALVSVQETFANDVQRMSEVAASLTSSDLVFVAESLQRHPVHSHESQVHRP